MKKVLLIITALLLILNLCSCDVLLEVLKPSGGDNGQSNGGQGGNNGGNDQDGDDDSSEPELKDELDDWGGASSIVKKNAALTVVKGTPTDIKYLVDEAIELDGAAWSSKCENVVTVSDGIVTGVKCGRTDVTVTDKNGSFCVISVTVEFLLSSNNGYELTTVEDKTVHYVNSASEADDVLEAAIINHTAQITLDFSALGSGYVAHRDYAPQCEFGNHISIMKRYYESKPHLLYLEITYRADSASTFTPTTAQNTYVAMTNANMVIRKEAYSKSDKVRADDFEGFPIYLSNAGTMNVYNSEELWWALEHNYLPVFPMQNSKAELFFERSKMILREIITEDMDDYAKALAIFDYLVDNVAYDYDAFYRDSSESSHTDVCYYLEGVFERGRAVCDGKSKAFVLLCGIEGIECVRDFGSKLSGAVGHAWNYVKLDGVWYLVDTTAADAAQSAENGFNGYFGKRIEMTVYDMFLADVSSHRDEYYYSPLFEYITDTNQINVNNTAVFTEKIFGTGYDFKMESKAELEMLIEIILAEDTDVGSECVLVVTLAQAFGSSSNAFSAIDKGISDSGSDAEYQIFTGTMSGVDILYITMKNV